MSTDRARSARPAGLARQWLAYLGRRLLGVLGVVAVLLVVTFVIVRLVPGDPARNIVGLNASQEKVDVVRERLGLDDPWLIQAWNYVSGVLTGDFGQSFRTSQPIDEMIAQRLPETGGLALGGLLVVLLVGFPLGLLFGMLERRRRRPRLGGTFIGVTSLVGALPEYIVGTFLVLLLAIQWRVFPASGGGSVEALVLPSIAVGLAAAAVMARIVRNETLDVLGQEYINAARAKRIGGGRLMVQHVLPNVVTSTLTVGGLILIALLGGTLITENVFNIPGLGTEVVAAILQNDYPSVQGIIVVLGVLAALINLAVDVVLGLIDPRVLEGRSA